MTSNHLIELYYDLPIEYKELKIYPATMRDYYYFHMYADCLLQDKNSIPDPKVISMTYLDYLYKYTTDDEPFASQLLYLLMMVLKLTKDDIHLVYDKNDKAVIIIQDSVYDANDFEEIKNIICEQNMLEVPDETIQKEIRDAMESAQRLKQRMSKNKMCSLEDQMICVMIGSSLKLEDIYDLTIRKFSKILQRIDHTMHYKIYLSASMSGMVEFKNKDFIKHWMVDLETKDKLEGSMIPMDELKDNLGKGNTAVFR